MRKTETKVDVIVLAGGLGNQLFQYAFYLAKKHNNNSKRIIINDYPTRRAHNGYELNRLFNIPVASGFFLQNIVRLGHNLLIFQQKKGLRNICSFALILLKLVGIKVIPEKKKWTVDNEAFSQQTGFCLYFGLWHTENYFSSIRQEVLKAFSFDETAISPQTAVLLNLIENTNSVSIHVRRGDYLKGNNRQIFEDISSSGYYDKAINEIEKHIESPVFIVFSDDIEWVKSNLQIPDPHYVNWNQKKEAWQDMFLMSKCKHNIIANSTFSWWGAWLNQSPQKKVIAPTKFSAKGLKTVDLVPESWVIV
jgi:hypothetical protein